MFSIAVQSSCIYSRVSEKAGTFLIISSLNSPSLVREEGSDSGVHYYEKDGYWMHFYCAS